MAKRVPCNVCGELRWPSTHSGAPAAPTCRSCRAANVEHGSVLAYKGRGCRCADCRSAWNTECAKYRKPKVKIQRACIDCGSSFNPRANQVTCSPECRRRHLGRLGSHHSRALHYGVAYEIVDRRAVFDRDGWVCGICSLPVDCEAAFPDPGAATLDHIVPMSAGGGHVSANVQLAHFYCNTVKGARADEAIAC